MRIGQSSDIHRFAADRELILGGVTIPHEKGLLGHSDADALLHAIAESILGALALGDLGKHFPTRIRVIRNVLFGNLKRGGQNDESKRLPDRQY